MIKFKVLVRKNKIQEFIELFNKFEFHKFIFRKTENKKLIDVYRIDVITSFNLQYSKELVNHFQNLSLETCKVTKTREEKEFFGGLTSQLLSDKFLKYKYLFDEKLKIVKFNKKFTKELLKIEEFKNKIDII